MEYGIFNVGDQVRLRGDLPPAPFDGSTGICFIPAMDKLHGSLLVITEIEDRIGFPGHSFYRCKVDPHDVHEYAYGYEEEWLEPCFPISDISLDEFL